ncbi:WD40 repeat domain-containing serine/threonine protein kinase [Gimesia maris]|uniref:WD40 repeat domain-containing serine/threonine protein kinase n=1 Tax=Gimesia maris TaxID=122 RepID=UPI0030D709CD|tara:strand:- start:98718 stop:102230 length:3513 start_codon:yes stop_codon:yes gene_type:complete
MIEQLRFDDYQQIDSVCDAFESDWTPESALNLKIVSEQCPAHVRRFAFLELLKVDVELRQRQGVNAARIDYLSLFPEYREIIDDVIEPKGLEANATLISSQLSPMSGDHQADRETSADSCFGRFLLQEELGQGAFGTVYRAYDPTLDREVALKLPRFDHHDQERIGRFLAEAQIAAQLQHPHIVAVWERGQVGDQYYISSSYVQGETLKERLAHERPGIRQIVVWIRDLAEALAYAHEQHVIHRDIKPANVIINQQRHPMIMDFGLAKRINHARELTTDGLILGTPAYMSPEQARGNVEEMSTQIDQYSLGMIFYELLTGQPRWQAKTHEILLKLQSDPPPPDINHGERSIPIDLIAVCQKMLQPQSVERYSDCQAVADDLSRWLEGHSVSVRRVSQTERFVKWCHRNRVISSLIVSTALILVVSLAVVSYALLETSEARDQVQDHLNFAQEQEQIAKGERDNALEAAVARRKESARSSLLLAGYHIRAGHFYEAQTLLDGIDEVDRNWVWGMQAARVPEIVCRLQHPEGKEFLNPTLYFNGTGEKIAVSHVIGNQIVTWLFDAKTGLFIEKVAEEYQLVSPSGAGFTKGGRYLVLRLTKKLPVKAVVQLGVYDAQEKRIIALREEVRNFAPSRTNSNEVVLQILETGSGRYRYYLWDFISGKTVDFGTGPYCLPFNFSVNAAGTELALRHKNLMKFQSLTGGENVSQPVMERLGATHWNLSEDQKFAVGQLKDPWPWNRRGKMVPAGQTAVVKFPAQMISVLETEAAVSHALHQYAELQSATIDSFRQGSGFFLTDNGNYVILNASNSEMTIPQKKELCWWNRQTGEYLGKTMGIAVSPGGDQFATIEAKAVLLREAPVQIRRFRSETVETELARWEPVSPPQRQKVFPRIVYWKEEPWVIVAHDNGTNTVDLEARVVSIRYASDRFYDQVHNIAYHARTGMLALLNGDEHLEILSLETGKHVAKLPCDPHPVNSDIAFHPDGKRIAVGHADKLVVWSIPEQRMIVQSPEYKFYEGGAGKLKFSPDGKYLFYLGTRIETRTWKKTEKQPFTSPRSVNFSPDSRLIAIDTADGIVNIYDAVTDQLVHRITTDAQTVHSRFHPREPLLAVVRDDGHLLIYDTRDWQIMLDEPVPQGGLADLVFSRSGDSLAVGIQIRATRRWFEFSSIRKE